MYQHTNPNTDSHNPAPNRHTFHDASEYLDRGWNVLPLHGKRPALVSWKELQNRRVSHDEVRNWFKDADINVGIITGAISRLIVIDCDTPTEVSYWRDHFPATPLVVRTGRGGAHFYYQTHPSLAIGNRVRIFGRAIDIRGDGGYVVAPPSRHPNGTFYAWEPMRGYCLDEVPHADPRWAAREDVTNAVRPPLHQAIQAPRAYIRQIRAVAGQRGHDRTFRVACILRDAGLSPEETLAELLCWNETNADPRWSPHELLHKVESVFKPRDGERE